MRGAFDEDISRRLVRAIHLPRWADEDWPEPMEVNVIYTGARGTKAALRAAGMLAHGLHVRINLMVAQAVPYSLPLSHPAVPTGWMERRLTELAGQGLQGPVETRIYLYLCREARAAILKALRPASIVVVGGQKHWWRSREQRLAANLKACGHQVIFACAT